VNYLDTPYTEPGILEAGVTVWARALSKYTTNKSGIQSTTVQLVSQRKHCPNSLHLDIGIGKFQTCVETFDTYLRRNYGMDGVENQQNFSKCTIMQNQHYAVALHTMNTSNL
jgi:hypothetical protein